MLIDLIRHGATEPPGLLLGRTDFPLSEDGWTQFARQTMGRDWQRIVSSPLLRAREAAERLAQNRDLPRRIDPDWTELDFGEWDGRPLEALRNDPVLAAQLDAFYANEDATPPPGGEGWDVLRGRVARALERLLDEQGKADDRASALVVSHGGPIRTALAICCALPFVHLWTLRIAYGTRVTLRFGRAPDGEMWGEVIEIVQP